MVKPRSNDDEGRKWRRKIERYELLYDEYQRYWLEHRLGLLSYATKTKILNHRLQVSNASHVFEEASIFVVRSDMADRVQSSENYGFNASVARQLPSSYVWLEFSKPIFSLADAIGNHRLSAISFSSGIDNGIACADFYFTPAHKDVLVLPQASCQFKLDTGESFVAAYEEFGGDMGNYGRVSSDHECQILRIARNFYDMLVCRQFQYKPGYRPEPKKDLSEFRRLKHAQYGNAKLQRIYHRLCTVREVSQPSTDKRRIESIGSPCRVKVPGCFHHWVFCKWCMENEDPLDKRVRVYDGLPGVHRHDMIGKPCRNPACQRIVDGDNKHLEPVWHAPYIRGKDGPLKERVFHVV